MATIEDGDDTLGAAWQTRRARVFLSSMPAGGAALMAAFVAARGLFPPGVQGPEAEVAEFGWRFADRTGAEVIPGITHNIYRCDRLLPIAAGPGSLRPARLEEEELSARQIKRPGFLRAV